MQVSSHEQAAGPVSGRRTKVCAAPHDSGVCADILTPDSPGWQSQREFRAE
jgi:hypothetical protein